MYIHMVMFLYPHKRDLILPHPTSNDFPQQKTCFQLFFLTIRLIASWLLLFSFATLWLFFFCFLFHHCCFIPFVESVCMLHLHKPCDSFHNVKQLMWRKYDVCLSVCQSPSISLVLSVSLSVCVCKFLCLNPFSIIIFIILIYMFLFRIYVSVFRVRFIFLTELNFTSPSSSSLTTLKKFALPHTQTHNGKAQPRTGCTYYRHCLVVEPLSMLFFLIILFYFSCEEINNVTRLVFQIRVFETCNNNLRGNMLNVMNNRIGTFLNICVRFYYLIYYNL